MPEPGQPKVDASKINHELRDIWNGVTNDLIEAEEAQMLSWEIGQHSKEINDSTFGRFFGSLQHMSSKYS